jgi:hypothetical protein
MHTAIDSDRICTQGDHDVRPNLKINLSLRTDVYDPRPKKDQGFVRDSHLRQEVRTYIYQNHYCPVCNLLYYFPEQSPEDEKSIQKMLDSLKEKI